MTKIILNSDNVRAAAGLESRPRFAQSMDDPLAADRVCGTRYPLPIVGSHTLSAIKARPQRYSLDDSQQMSIGSRFGILKYQSATRMTLMPGAEPICKTVANADDALLAVLHPPPKSLPLAVNVNLFVL
jgi:hypothetical protein